MKKLITLLLCSVITSTVLAYGSVGAGSSSPSSNSDIIKVWRGSTNTPIGAIQEANLRIKELKTAYRNNNISMEAYDSGISDQLKIFNKYGYLAPTDY